LELPTQNTESGTGVLAKLQQLVADFVDRLVPTDFLVLAVDELHRRLQTIFAVSVLANRRALRAMRAEVERRVEHRLLASPYSVLTTASMEQPTEQWVHTVRFTSVLVASSLAASALPMVPYGSWLANAPAPATSPERFKNVRLSIVGCLPTTRRRRGLAAEARSLFLVSSMIRSSS
jgi:hypothetical protein